MGGLVLAILLLALAVVSLIAYNGTPHAGGTDTCGPITFFNWTFNVHADCRAVAIPEIAAAVIFFVLALWAAVAARPGRG